MKDFELVRHNVNHLVVLWAILERGGVTQAAEALGRSQSSVSHILAQLRERFQDPLLIRVSGRWEPTPLAKQLGAGLGPALLQLHNAVHGARFDPATSGRNITLLGAEHLTSMLLRATLPALRTHAPRMTIRVSAGVEEPLDVLCRGDVEFALVERVQERAGIAHQQLMIEDFVCLAPRASVSQGNLALEDFCALPHVQVTWPGGQVGFVDDALSTLGRTRRVAMRFPSFSSALAMVTSIPEYLLVLPRHMCPPQVPGLVQVRAPIVLPARAVHLVWHERHQEDPGHMWVREQMFAAFQEYETPVSYS